MKYVFLVNQFSLKDETEGVIERIKIICEKLNQSNYVIEVNSLSESTEDILARYKNSKDIIFAIGGDGTINRVLNGIVGTENTLGFIPYGTGNDFYRYQKEQGIDGFEKIDLVRINDKYFINVACFGIDADIANEDDIIHSNWIPKSQRYNVGVLYHFLKYKARRMQVLIDGEEIAKEFTTIAVCNAKYYGGGYKIGPNSDLKDGVIEVYLVDKLNKINMARLILSMKDAGHEKSSKVRKITTKSLSISSDTPVSCNIDGEALTASNFEIEVIPGGIDIYYNQELIDGIVRTRKK